MSDPESPEAADEPAEGAPPASPARDAAPRPSSTPLRSDRLVVELDHDPHANFALHQNGVPIVKALRIRNLADEPLSDARVVLWAEPDLAGRTELSVPEVPAHGTWRVDQAIELPLSGTRLLQQTERERGRLWVEVAQQDEVLLREDHPLDVTAYGEWPGAASLPEILAAFVLPNHPEVERVLARAGHLVGERTRDPSLGGYQGRDPARVREVVRAIHDGMAALGLTYVVPPASFEAGGQKIRTPEQILEAGMATCLDLAVFFAAALEHAGIHAVIGLFEDHALVGAWLDEECFVDPALDEILRLRKRHEMGSIVFFDPVGVTARPPRSFDQATEDAARRLDEGRAFLYAVDVRAARRSGIRPLPVRRAEDAYTLDEEEPESPPAPRAPLPRVERWKRKLLDLTLRNRLINYRPTRRSIAISCPDLRRLEERLVDGRGFRLFPEPETPLDPEKAIEELGAGRLRTLLQEEELERRLVHVYRAARSSLQEGGANTLYLALGFLEWKEAPSNPEIRRAPILLLPLTMTRRSLAEGTRGYVVELADDDAQINVTLLQKLEADFDLRVPDLERRDEDEPERDAGTILDLFRAAIRPMPGWRVTEDVALGLFSFTKFLMWRDLDQRAEALSQNDVVHHLLETPEVPFVDSFEFPEPRTFDGTRSPTDTFVPADADSSQQAAIFAAADGHTFVLEGPPGTGKSQTITNLICHALASGKRVLFVSEKIAALDVVHRRLKRAGLDPFCLELHSNKARKRAVLEQMRQALEVAGAAPPDDWPRVAERLAGVRDELDAVRRALHEVRPLGRSAFQGLARLIALRDTPRVRLDLGERDALDARAFEERSRLVHDAARLLSEEVGDTRENAWRASRLDEWRPSIGDRVDELTPRLANAAAAYERAAHDLAGDLGVDGTGLSRADLRGLGEAAELLATSPAPPARLLTVPDDARDVARIESWIGALRRVREHEASLGRRYREAVLDVDLEGTRRRLEASRASFWPISWLKARRPRKTLEDVALAGGSIGDPASLIADIDRAIDWRQRREELLACDAEARGSLGDHWSGLATDPGALAGLLEWVSRFRRLFARFAARESDTEIDRLRERWVGLAQEGRLLFSADAPAGGHRRGLEAAEADVAGAQEACEEAFRLDPGQAWDEDDAASFTGRLQSTAAAWREAGPGLRSWSAWVRKRRSLESSGLGALLEALAEGRVDAEGLEPAFEHGLFAWWVSSLFEEDEILRRFRGREQDARADDLRELDREVMDTIRDVVLARLGERLPTGRAAASSRSDSSEMGLLHRELMRKRNIPIRRLFERIPHALSLLKPCMLMSPLSVAQYLSPEFPPFDLVVFDEASQIPPWDAVGAIARGEKLVVVGDSKQMPPTNFFQRSEQGEDLEDEDDLEEMESILDECVAARLPRLHLKWHYRSRHESLIAFSNRHYYDDRLYTFPSAVEQAPHLGVRWHDVEDGVYDRGRSRTNPREAEALVGELVRRLRDPAASTRSHGIVTFSIAQQGLVEDLLEARRREHPEIEAHFDDSREEPVFIKNLENVQGDERDVILLSVCYGPDAGGRVALNFGPLNREGGERRLNVAITRAREQVLVFSSLRSEHIDLARTQSRGARELKAFLDYAERGESALGQRLASAPATGRGPAEFEATVRRALEATGWTVDARVGCSAYRVDLGVRDPEEPTRYLAAIESDGAMYDEAATVRDRHLTRPGVLGHLGWRHLRIWAADWWQDPEGELRRLVTRLEDARAARAKAAPQRAPVPVPEGEAADGAPSSDDASDSEPAPSGRIARGPPETEPRDAVPDRPLGIALGGGRYVKAALGRPPKDPRSIYDDDADSRVVERIEKVIQAEAPVAIELVARRLADAWGLKRLTARLRDRVASLLADARGWRFSATTADFLWRKDQDPLTWTAFRVPAEGEPPPRRARHVPPEEVANAAKALLREHVGIAFGDLARETGRLLGYRRHTEKVRAAMERGVRLLLEQDGARMDEDGRVLRP